MTGTAIIDQINQLRRQRRGPAFEMPLRCFPRSLWMDMVRREGHPWVRFCNTKCVWTPEYGLVKEDSKL